MSPQHTYNNMEQNQNPSSTAPIPQLNKQEQWAETRNEFAEEGESIGQSQDVTALVKKWIWIQHQQEFRNYQQELLETAGGPTLQRIIEVLLREEKQEAWMINQRYTMEQVNQIITKLRERIRQILKQKQSLNPEAQTPLQESKQQNPHINKTEAQPFSPIKGEQIDIDKFSSALPVIKSKGRVYLPQEMHSSFHLLKSTQEQYKIQSVSMFAPTRTKDPPRPEIFNNKYLKQTFKWLCKQGYNSKGLFQDFSKQGDRMSLNKWMIFCKEFNFTEKFHKKNLVSIFQTATKFASNMFMEEFLAAVALLQDRYVDKFHKGEGNFVAQVMQIDSEAAFRVKMDNLKVSYSGPRKNFFEYATYNEHERIDQIQRENQFKAKKHQRQIVLIKGMFQDHIKDEVRQRKAIREQLKTSRLGKSLNFIQVKEKSHQKKPPPNYHISRDTNINYTKLFHINLGLQQESNSSTTANTSFLDRKMYKTELAKIDPKTPRKVQHKRIDVEGKTNFQALKSQGESKRYEHINKEIQIKSDCQAQGKLPDNKVRMDRIVQQAAPERTWLTNIRSDTQQSDDILKEHMQSEKRVKETKVQALMKQMQEQSQQVQKFKQQMEGDNEQNEDDPDMVETQVNFNKEINAK